MSWRCQEPGSSPGHERHRRLAAVRRCLQGAWHAEDIETGCCVLMAAGDVRLLVPGTFRTSVSRRRRATPDIGLVRGSKRVPVRRGPAPPRQLVVRLPSITAQDIASPGIRARLGDSGCPSACSRHRSSAARCLARPAGDVDGAWRREGHRWRQVAPGGRRRRCPGGARNRELRLGHERHRRLPAVRRCLQEPGTPRTSRRVAAS